MIKILVVICIIVLALVGFKAYLRGVQVEDCGWNPLNHFNKTPCTCRINIEEFTYYGDLGTGCWDCEKKCEELYREQGIRSVSP